MSNNFVGVRPREYLYSDIVGTTHGIAVSGTYDVTVKLSPVQNLATQE